MRTVLMLLTVPLLVLGLAACGGGGSDTSSGSSGSSTASAATEKLTGKVNDKGTRDVSGKPAAKLEVEADDFYFEPTYVKADAGQRITVELHNEGKATHTFTSSSLGVDTELAPGAKKDVTVTVPDTSGPVEFHCTFHGAMGMRGAFVVGGGSGTAGTSGGGTGSSSTTSTTTSGSGYGS